MKKPNSLVYVDHLSVWGTLQFLRSNLRDKSRKVVFRTSTYFGRVLSQIFRKIGVISDCTATSLDKSLADHEKCKMWAAYEVAVNSSQTKRKEIQQGLRLLFPELNNRTIDIAAVGIEKHWQLSIYELLLEVNLAHVIGEQFEVPSSQTKVLSRNTDFSWALPKRENWICGSDPQVIEYAGERLACALRVLYWVLRQLSKKFFSLISSRSQEPYSIKWGIAVFGAWGICGKKDGRLDDLFWFRPLSMEGAGVKYIVHRRDSIPSEKNLEQLHELGVESLSVIEGVSEDSNHLSQIKRRRMPVGLIQDKEVNFRNIRKLVSCNRLENSLKPRLLLDSLKQFGKAIDRVERLAAPSIVGLFHHQEAGLEDVQISTNMLGGIRFGTHWSSFSGLNISSTRCHDVFFCWGLHDAKVVTASNSVSQYILLSGCFLTEYRNCSEIDHAQKFAARIRQQGVRGVLAAYDTSLPTPEYLRFLFNWVVDNEEIGLIIKPKGSIERLLEINQVSERYERAFRTGRVHVMKGNASPADAVGIADVSLGICGSSAISLAALRGGRVAMYDPEGMGESLDQCVDAFYSVTDGQCIFHTLEEFQSAFNRFLSHPEGHDKFGDARATIDKLDPFRDDLASERIGRFIDSFVASRIKGVSQSRALHLATTAYARRWGQDKVIRGL